MKYSKILILINLFSFSIQLHASNAWLTPDQQGAKLLQQGKAKEAAEVFSSPHWQGVAQFKSAQYEKAVKTFQSLPKTSQNHYNLGNALAHTGQYEKAIEAYNNAIKNLPGNQDAIHNKKIIENLLKKQKQKQDQQKQDQQKQDQQKQNQQKQNQQKQNQQKQNQQKQDKQKQDQQKQNQQKQNQQKQNQQKQNQQKQNQQKQNQQKQNQQKKDKQKQDQQQSQPSAKDKDKNQAEMQQLKRVPDNPGGLLKQKFLRDYINRHPEQRW
jgi:Ca-activated chloride channel family protein